MSYQGYECWKNWSKATFGTWSSADAAYFSAELRRCGIVSTANARVLEIGFGNGAFAGYVLSKGGAYVGSEINETLIERAREFGLNIFEDDIMNLIGTAKLESFDAVVAFDVLEHLVAEDIGLFLLGAHRLLRPGGILLARVPSGDSPFGRAIFHGDITHRSALGSSAVRQLASQTGFEVMDIGPPRFPIPGLGPVRAIRRGGIRLAQMLIARFINLVFHDGQPRVITANLVFVLRKPVKPPAHFDC